ncbi:MAG: flagellar assembly protein FliX [Proteobacteria bacterium]|nr:flagellar assembly protein FliX [Pseudomonadota bacterium]
MKVEGPNKLSSTKGVSKSGAKKSDGDGAFDAMIDETGEAEAQAPVSRVSPLGALDTLLALQGADGGTSEEARKRAKRRGADLLDHLDKIRTGLLTGELSQRALQQLSQTISSHRDSAIDPKLAEILDEIELRARVELAKLGL